MLAGHAAALPVQFSAVSQTPVEARQTVVLGRNVLAGHAADDPVQFSAVSQTPPEARQTYELGRNPVPGHARLTPSQTPLVSHAPAAAAQTVPAPAGMQTSVVSLQPPTQPETGQRAPEPVQAPAPLHVSVSVQNCPSLQAAPAGLFDQDVRLTAGSHHWHGLAGLPAPDA